MIVLLATLTYGIIEAPRAGLDVTGHPGGVFDRRRGADRLRGVRAPAQGAPHRPAVLPVDPVRLGHGYGGRRLRGSRGVSSFSNTLYLQEVRGLSPLRAGLATLPMAVMTMVASPLSGRIVGTRGPRLPLVVLRGGANDRLCHAGVDRADHALYLALRGLRSLRSRVRLGERAHHQRGRIGDAPGPGRGRGRPSPRHLASSARRSGSPSWAPCVTSRLHGSVANVLGSEPRRLVDPDGVRRGRSDLGVVATTRRAKESARRTARELNPEVFEQAAA